MRALIYLCVGFYGRRSQIGVKYRIYNVTQLTRDARSFCFSATGRASGRSECVIIKCKLCKCIVKHRVVVVDGGWAMCNQAQWGWLRQKKKGARQPAHTDALNIMNEQTHTHTHNPIE